MTAVASATTEPTIDSFHCKACDTTKPLSEFYPHNTRGHRSCCKDCDKRRVKAYQATPRGKEVIKITQANQNTPIGRARKKQRYSEWRKRNRDRVRANQRASYERLKHDVERKRRQRINNLKYFHGISIADYEAIERRQNGKCAICGGPPLKHRNVRRFHLDHDHKTGALRGLLCFRCNNGLGLFQDNCDVMAKAIRYLESHASNQ